MRLKLVTVGPPSRIRQSHPDPAPIDPASSEQLGCVQQLWPFECNNKIDKEEKFDDTSSLNAGT